MRFNANRLGPRLDHFYVAKTSCGWRTCVPIFGGYDQDVCDGLCWDELLWWLSNAMIHDQAMTSSSDITRTDTVEWEMEITNTDGKWWTIEKDGRFISMLTTGEALGFIAAYTLCGKELFGGFKTYEQWLKLPYHKIHAPEALLSA